jgi:hypothetical protein
MSAPPPLPRRHHPRSSLAWEHGIAAGSGQQLSNVGLGSIRQLHSSPHRRRQQRLQSKLPSGFLRAAAVAHTKGKALTALHKCKQCRASKAASLC